MKTPSSILMKVHYEEVKIFRTVKIIYSWTFDTRSMIKETHTCLCAFYLLWYDNNLIWGYHPRPAYMFPIT